MFQNRLLHHSLRITKKESFNLSTLSNGLRVLSMNDGSATTGLGLVTKNGCVEENANSFGAAAVLESLPFKGNAIISQEEISVSLGVLGNCFRMQNVKEHLLSLLMVPRYHAKEGLSLLNAMTLHPTKDPEVLANAKAHTLQRAALYDRDATRVCFELTHQAGWGGKGIGTPINPTEKQLSELTMEKLHAFHRRCTQPSRCVLVGTGIGSHEDFCKMAEETLVFPAPSTEPNAPQHSYVGGYSAEYNINAPDSVKKFAEKNLSHVCIMFQGVKISDPDYYIVSLIQTLLGGGTSFSSGGPGKGMQTKLWREVLRKEGYLHGIECVSAWYTDGGMIGIYGSCPHEYIPHLVRIIIYQMSSIAQRVTQEMIDMAKNQMRSQLILLGEGREQLLTDMGNNLSSHDYITTATDIMQGTENISVAALQRVCDRLIQHPITYAVYGDTKANIPDYDTVVKAIRSTYTKMNKKV